MFPTLGLFSTWSTGLLNGVSLPEKGLPASYKYGMMGLTSGLCMMNAIGRMNVEQTRYMSRYLAGTVVGIPIMVGAVFCTGHFLGKSTRYAWDSVRYLQRG